MPRTLPVFRFCCTFVGGGKGNFHLQFSDTDIMPVSLWVPTHFQAQRQLEGKKNKTQTKQTKKHNLMTKSIGEMDADTIATYYFELSGILTLHFNHIYRV